MSKDNINRLKQIVQTTSSQAKRTYALWLLLTYYIKHLTTDELFYYIPFIWKVDNVSGKYPNIRHKIEHEIILRQDTATIVKLLDLLTNDNSFLRFFSTSLLSYFTNDIVIEPLLNYLEHTTDKFMAKRQAICALRNYKNSKVKQYLQEEYERHKTNPDAFFKANYLALIERLMNK